MSINRNKPRLNPRRAGNAERLRDFLYFHGGKLFLTRPVLKKITSSQSMRRSEIDTAVDDLCAMGAIVNRIVGETEVIEAVDHQGAY